MIHCATICGLSAVFCVSFVFVCWCVGFCSVRVCFVCDLLCGVLVCLCVGVCGLCLCVFVCELLCDVVKCVCLLCSVCVCLLCVVVCVFCS